MIIVVFAFQVSPQTLGEKGPWYDASPYLEIIFFVLMFLGMSARYVTKAIETRREKILELQKQGTPFV